MKYKLVVFDMDGTILDTLEDLTNSVNFGLAKNGLPKRTIDEVRYFVGNGIHRLVERAVPANADDEQIEKVFAALNEHYAVHCADNTKPYAGVNALIAELRRRGVKTAVVSNKADYGVQALCKQYFDGLFDCAVGEQEGVRRKPCPDSVNMVLSKLAIDRSEAVYIGDSDVDVNTAKNAQMDCIAVEWGFRKREELVAAGATLIVADTAELLAALE